MAWTLVLLAVACKAEPSSPHVLPPSSGKVKASYDPRKSEACPGVRPEARREYEKGMAAWRVRDIRTAIDRLDRALELDPGDCDALDSLGQIYRSVGSVEDAIRLYWASLAIAPNDAVAHLDLGAALRLHGDLEAALAQYGWLVQNRPDDPEGWFGEAQVLHAMHRDPEGILYAKHAEGLYERSGSDYLDDARLLLGILYAGANDWPHARDALEQVYARYGGDPEVNLTLGRAYLDVTIRDRAKARVYLSRARSLGAHVPAEVWDDAEGP